jgi:hypothetical protein
MMTFSNVAIQFLLVNVYIIIKAAIKEQKLLFEENKKPLTMFVLQS